MDVSLLEIVRVLEAMNELRESPDYELHRLTERSPDFFDEIVNRHLEGLRKELACHFPTWSRR